MFEARHGRGALDPASVTSWEVVSTTSGGITPTPSTNVSLYPNQREHIPIGTDLSEMGHQVISPSSGHIIGEGATIFTDMTETMLDALDQQMVLSAEAQKPESSLTDNTGQIRSQVTSDTKDSYPDLYLPVVENYK